MRVISLFLGSKKIYAVFLGPCLLVKASEKYLLNLSLF